MKKLFNSILDKLMSLICVIFILLWTLCVTIFVFPFHCFKNRDKIKAIKTEKPQEPQKTADKKQTHQ